MRQPTQFVRSVSPGLSPPYHGTHDTVVLQPGHKASTGGPLDWSSRREQPRTYTPAALRSHPASIAVLALVPSSTDDHVPGSELLGELPATTLALFSGWKKPGLRPVCLERTGACTRASMQAGLDPETSGPAAPCTSEVAIFSTSMRASAGSPAGTGAPAGGGTCCGNEACCSTARAPAAEAAGTGEVAGATGCSVAATGTAAAPGGCGCEAARLHSELQMLRKHADCVRMIEHCIAHICLSALSSAALSEVGGSAAQGT